MADVFISSASEDRARVRRLATALEAQNFTVWWDRALAPGEDDAASVERALKDAKAVIVVWTAASAASPLVRDEAGRARDDGRLFPVLIDRGVETPLGFGAYPPADFTGWTGDPRARAVKALADAVRARLQGRTVDVVADKARRRRSMLLVPALALAAAMLLFAAGATLFVRERAQVAERQDQLSVLLELAAEGSIPGDEALELATLLQTRAFADVPASAEPAADAAPLPAPPAATRAQRAAMAEAPRVNRRDMLAAARQSFEDAAATLLQDPDPRVRRALLQVRDTNTRQAGLDALWAQVGEGEGSTPALLRACGALMLAVGDDRAAAALEQARALNPQDRDLWRLLSYSYARRNRPLDAAGAALVGEGIRAAATGNWRAATARLERALPLVTDAQTRGFVLGQMGDAAAATENWAGAEASYASAVEAHGADRNIAALALDSSKLARAQLKQGEGLEACATLRRARRQGAAVTEAELAQACGSLPPNR